MPELLTRRLLQEKTGRGYLLNRPSCPPDDPIGQGTELNLTVLATLQTQWGEREREGGGREVLRTAGMTGIMFVILSGSTVLVNARFRRGSATYN